MPSTKIINVLRDDDFESVFNVFEGTSAKEVILILPKNSHFAKKAENFMTMKAKAEELGKVVSIMSEDESIQEFVEDHLIHLSLRLCEQPGSLIMWL